MSRISKSIEEVDWWLPRAGGDGKSGDRVMVKGIGFLFRVVKMS